MPVPLCPEIDDRRHEIKVPKPPEQHDQTGNIVGVISPFDETLPRCGIIRIRLLQLHPRLLVTQRYRNGFPIFLVIVFGASFGVTHEVEHGALLPFGPETLPFRVRTGRGQDAHALTRQQQQHQNDDEERPDDLQQAAAPGKEGERPLRRVLPPSNAVDSYWINKPAPLWLWNALQGARPSISSALPKPRPAQGSSCAKHNPFRREGGHRKAWDVSQTLHRASGNPS